MHWKNFRPSIILLLFVVYFFNPKPSYAWSCNIRLFYEPTLVIATVEDQTINCEDYKTTTKFNRNFVIKGFSPSQFELKTVNRSAWNTCKNYPHQSKESISVGSRTDPEFKIGKTYLISILPKNNPNTLNVDLPICQQVVNEIDGWLDPKVIVNSILVYTQPVLVILVILPMFLALYLSKSISITLSFILSGFISLVLYEFILYLLVRIVKYIKKKIKNT